MDQKTKQKQKPRQKKSAEAPVKKPAKKLAQKSAAKTSAKKPAQETAQKISAPRTAKITRTAAVKQTPAFAAAPQKISGKASEKVAEKTAEKVAEKFGPTGDAATTPLTPQQEKQRKKILALLRRRALKNGVEMTEHEEQILIKEQEDIKKAVKNIKFSSTLRQVWELLSGTRKKIPWLFLFMVINSVMGLIGTGMVIPFIIFLQNADAIYADVSTMGLVQRYAVLASRAVFDALNFTSSSQLVIFFGVAFLAMFALRVIVGVFIGYVMNLYTAYATKNLTQKIYTVILYMSYSYYLGRSSAQTMFAMSLSGRAFGIIIGLLSLVNDLLFIIVLGLGIAILTPAVLIIGAVLCLVSVGMYKLINRELRRIAELELVLSKKQSMAMYQGVHNFTFSRLFSAEPFFLRVFHMFYDRTIPLSAYKSVIASLPRIVLEISITFAFVFYALFIIVRHPDRAGEVITTAAVFAAAVFKLMPAALRITGYMGTLAGDQAAVNEFYEEYQTALHHRVEEVRGQIEKLPFEKSIEIQHVQFAYPVFEDKGRKYNYDKSPLVLRDVSFSIKKGQKIGIVGGSGSGKTTLIHILMAFLNPLKGSVLVDGQNIHANMRAWQQDIGYVPQETLLMEDSITNNIAFGISEDEIDLAKVRRVLKIAQLDSFVESLPKGIHTKIGDHGKRLSGGQRQRLGIARALYRDPTVLFFDEATSHLDVHTEKEVQAAIDNLPRNKTLIIVAHRINTLKACDVIYKMDGGAITFAGSYAKLCALMEKTA